MRTQTIMLEELCGKGSSSLMQRDVTKGDGIYPVYGASGLIGYIDTYKQENEYIGIVKDGAGVGRVFVLPKKSSVIGTMQYLLPKKGVDVRYLYHALTFLDLGKYCTGATIPHIYYRDYKKELLPFYSMEDQVIIGGKLDSVLELIKKRREQLHELDNLVKSQFIEMFGGYDLRDKQGDWIKISEIAEVVGGSTPKTNIEKYWDGDFLWVTPAEIASDTGLLNSTERTITKEGVDSCSLKVLPRGTVLLSSRAPIGKVAIVGKEMYCNQGFKNLICRERVNPWYIYHLLKYNNEYLNSLGRGATFKEISKSIVENIYIPIPSRKQQDGFARFVEQIDKSKFRIKESLKNLENCYKALLQKYFG